MTPETREGYARLPEDLLQKLLTGAGDVADQVVTMLGPALEMRDRLRGGLTSLDLIEQLDNGDILTIAGVDGGFAVERTSAVDIALSVAVGVEGLTGETKHWDSTQYEWWTRVARHDLETERLARGVMIAQELAILKDAPHDIRILDGSHMTLVIQLNSALTVQSKELLEEAKRIWEKLYSVDSLADVVTDQSIIAMPKYDSSRFTCELLQRELGLDIPGDDKYLLGVLLQPGEFLKPHQVLDQPWSALHLRSEQEVELAKNLENAILPLKQRKLNFTYFKPTESSPAFRIEFKHQVSMDLLRGILSTLAAQITGPFIKEPYPQYLADVMAKSVGLGLSALQTAVQLNMSGKGRPEIAELLLHSYRTEGV